MEIRLGPNGFVRCGLKSVDVLVVGAGPAGLTAAIYLARFRLSVAVVDAGQSRAALIPRTHNHAGYPGGIPGRTLLALMRQQAGEFGIVVQTGVIGCMERKGERFVARSTKGAVSARAVLLATGVVNNRPPINDEDHDVALERGLLRYCPICDGYEITDRRVAVIGTGTHGHNEAVFLRMYTRDVTLIAPDAQHSLELEDRDRLQSMGVRLIDGPCGQLEVQDSTIGIPTPSGLLSFDSCYPALGSVIRSELAIALGADATDDGCLVVDEHQRTTIPGLYTAGDVAKGLDQISHAMGEAAVAATAIRNDFAARSPLLR